MAGNDPHIHGAAKAVHGDAAVRIMAPPTLGLADDLSSRVTTGCGHGCRRP